MEIPAVTFAALTDVGKKRDHNEDNFLVDKKLSLFIVCDGMGGHAAGEVASAIAVRTIHEEVKKEEDLLADYSAGRQGADKVSKRELLNMLEFAANRASSKVHEAARADSKKRGMGTTLVAILFVASQAFIVHVGDSRVYLLRAGTLEQLTDDHNVYNELVKRKKLSREQVTKLAPKNAITRAVGVYESCEPDTLVIDVAEGDQFLLCTDGLSEYFEAPHSSPADLSRLLTQPDMEGVASSLIGHANARGGKDNITAVLVRVGDQGQGTEDRAKNLERRKAILAQVPLFKALDDRELRRVLQVTEVHRHQDGETIVTEGERGESLYIVLSGQVGVFRGETEVKALDVGEHFGEMALIRSQPRSATVRSKDSSELLVMRRPEFFEILRSQPQIAVKLLWQFTGVLAERLADTTRDLGKARTELAEELEPEDITDDLFATDDDDDDDRKTVELPPAQVSTGSSPPTKHVGSAALKPPPVPIVALDDESPPTTSNFRRAPTPKPARRSSGPPHIPTGSAPPSSSAARAASGRTSTRGSSPAVQSSVAAAARGSVKASSFQEISPGPTTPPSSARVARSPSSPLPSGPPQRAAGKSAAPAAPEPPKATTAKPNRQDT